MLFARVCEGEAKVDESFGQVYKGDGQFLPFVPVTSGFNFSARNFVSIGGDQDLCPGASGGVADGEVFAVFNPESGVFNPVRVINCSNEFDTFTIEDLGTFVGGERFSFNSMRVESNRSAS